MKRRPGHELRNIFPQLARNVRGQQLVYLDNAATTLKPRPVIEAVTWYYSSEVSNIHRAAHYLSDQGTSQYESVREKVKTFINAQSSEEVIFTKGTTEGVNLLASGLASQLKPGDVILISEMEHHSNIVPWQIVAEKTGAAVAAISVTDQGELDQEDFQKKLTDRVKIMSLVHASNSLGTVNPLADMIRLAKARGITTIVDAAQSVALGLVDVQKLDCDFLVFSGHKLYGPTGVGVLYGRKAKLNALPPYQGGGSMISTVTIQKSTYLPAPHRFEAGTPPIAEVIGLGAAIDFVNQFDWLEVLNHERALSDQVVAGLQSMGGIKLIGNSSTRQNIVSFVLEGAHPSDVGHLLDQQGVAVRTGHHCCQPLMARFQIPGTVRASFAAYTDANDIELFLKALIKAKGMLT